MVPKGWTLLQVSDICKLQNGNSFKPHEWDTQGLPIIRIQNLNGSDNYNYFSGVPQDKWLVEPGQLLFSWAGTKGVSFGPFIWNGPKGVLNQHIYKVFANENVHGHWLYLALLHITQKIEAQAHGFKSTLLHVQKKDIDNQFVLTPPVAEQKKIAQILSTWDNAISVTEKLLTNSQQQKKALMQQLLTGKKRLLDENGVRFSGEWKRVKLGAIADMNSGGTPKSTVEEYYGGNIPWVSISDMTSNGKWIATTEKYLTELGLNSSSARIYPKNSVLYAMYASIGECSIAAVNLTSSQAILGIRPKDCLNYEFLYFYLTSLKEKIKLQGQQGTQSNLNAGMVKEFELDLPSIREQQKIAAVLSVADAEISTLEKKLACLRDEKKALMQQLLTGKRRVKVDEAVAE
ncbi:restriction endonuclease subunit S [Escherichia coli]|uniref:restriction endonuclease subunit S n=1 Tax=Escherichia coli TaxID=562 RepID=UPI000BB7E3F7|nr:restriction endonuclease subunit S [Escherichia coli]MCV5253057.1 restriction endonuclease subunit S [Escherichia coli]MCV5328356.1 restriction endonuclease subunit S [Escherichia coli]MCV5337025.1 restriction endonuclease subunit S [Escherichia coli]MCV5385016.1 restriction endonuclease subunit S [Escherichia coli]